MRVNRIVNKPQSQTKPTIHNVFILDSSGSMRENNKYEVAKAGLNEEIEMLKAEENINYTQSLIEFSGASQIYTQYFLNPIKSIGKFNGVNLGGMTALNDAIGHTIDSLLQVVKEGEKVLLKIFTDGGENDSKKHSASKIKELISKVERENGFTVTFEGTKSDTSAAIRNYGISASNTHVHDNTAAGVTRGVQARVAATVAYSKSVLAGEDVTLNFYTKSVE